MNNIKYITLVIVLFIGTNLLAQQKTNSQEFERVLVYDHGNAVIAILDQEGHVLKKIMDIPDYFEEGHADTYYIKQSYEVMSDKKLATLLTKADLATDPLATSESLDPENQ